MSCGDLVEMTLMGKLKDLLYAWSGRREGADRREKGIFTR